jgi:hypothetical protein
MHRRYSESTRLGQRDGRREPVVVLAPAALLADGWVALDARCLALGRIGKMG